MSESLMERDRPDAAWCSHCVLVLPHPLVEAILHRRANHPSCISCQAEILLFRALLDGRGHPVDFA